MKNRSAILAILAVLFLASDSFSQPANQSLGDPPPVSYVLKKNDIGEATIYLTGDINKVVLMADYLADNCLTADVQINRTVEVDMSDGNIVFVFTKDYISSFVYLANGRNSALIVNGVMRDSWFDNVYRRHEGNDPMFSSDEYWRWSERRN